MLRRVRNLLLSFVAESLESIWALVSFLPALDGARRSSAINQNCLAVQWRYAEERGWVMAGWRFGAPIYP